MTPVQLPEVEVVRSVLRYDPETGDLCWLHDRGRNRLAGKRAGTTDRAGYGRVMVAGKNCLAHRIAWLMFHGAPPDGEIDHINGDRGDNRIENLRVVSRRQNMQNITGHRAGRLVGASYYKSRGNWRAYIWKGKKRLELGYFSTEEGAHNAYMAALKEMESINVE